MATDRSEFNRKIQAARKAAGLSLDEAWADARVLYPETPSREAGTVRGRLNARKPPAEAGGSRSSSPLEV